VTQLLSMQTEVTQAKVEKTEDKKDTTNNENLLKA
jgi:hypothetical protein